MTVFRESDSARWQREVSSLLAGGLAGLLIGFVASRWVHSPPSGGELREKMRGAARRLRPARRERLLGEQLELDRLEDDVIDAFLRDEVLAERAVDIGALSPGIVEISGRVRSEDEAQRAVSLARTVAGVRTVVNRLDVGSPDGGYRPPRLDIDSVGATFAHQEGRVGGMGRRRQSPETDPDRRDDSQHLRENALAAADRDQWLEEGYAPVSGRAGESSSIRGVTPTHFDESELDNQDPGRGESDTEA